MKRLPFEPTREPTRILDLLPPDDPAHAARLVRSAILSPTEAVPKLKGRIRHTLRRKSVWRHRYLRVALVGGLVFLTGGVVGAVVQPILNWWPRRTEESVEKALSSPAAPRARHRRGSAPLPLMADQGLLDDGLLSEDQPGAPPTLPPVPAPVLAPTLVPALAPQPAESGPARSEAASVRVSPARAPSARAVSLPPVSPTVPLSAGPAVAPIPAGHSNGRDPLRTAMLEPPPSQPESWPTSRPAPPAVAPKPMAPPPPSEQALLSRALRSLRSERRPESALAVLEEYVARFPNGSLLPEVTRLRTEALLALGHKPAALAELNREPVPGTAGLEESRLVRGELHAAAGRWREALADFDAVVGIRIALEPSARPMTSGKLRERFERALWGRASARSHLGDDAGARADLNESLRRFPQGRFAVQAARLLGELR